MSSMALDQEIWRILIEEKSLRGGLMGWRVSGDGARGQWDGW